MSAAIGGPLASRRLSQAQYQQIIADVFGPDIDSGGRFVPEIREGGLLAVGASSVSMPASGLEQYQSLARSIAAQVVDAKHRGTLIGCQGPVAGAVDAACAKAFVVKTGRLLFRRPLAADEIRAQEKVYSAALDKLGDPYAAIEAGLTAMLAAPEFLFNWETAEDDPSRPGVKRLDAYSKAARLSFFLWNTAPDDELLTAAERGQLHTTKGWTAQVERLLASERTETSVRAFFTDMFGFDAFDALAKDAALYPKFTLTASNDAREQTLRTVVDHLLIRDGDYRDLFTTHRTFLTRRLGAVYRLPIESPEDWEAYEFPASDPRGAGILAHASFVALHSHPARTSPTLRGKALREILLCQKVPDPPGNVNFAIVQDTANPSYRTVRQRLTAHATEAMCTGCHKLIDPIGLALENFDTGGGYRMAENGAAIDTSGVLDGIAFNDAAGLSKAVHDHPSTTTCVTNRLYAYAIGRAPTKGESQWLSEGLVKQFAQDGFRIRPLMRRIVLSDGFINVVEVQANQKMSTQVSAASPQKE